MDDRAKILDKIRKCLRLSKSSNEHEAAAALRQAQKLMQQLGLSHADVLAADVSDSKAKSGSASRPVSWEAYLANVCCSAFGCEVIFEAGAWVDMWRRRAGSWQFVGCDGRAELCSYAFVVLARRLRVARSAYIKSKLQRCKRKTQVARADQYCIGWIACVEKTVIDFARTDADRQAVAAWISATGIKLKSTSIASRKVRGATGDALAGLLDGGSVRLDRPIDGRQQEALARG